MKGVLFNERKKPLEGCLVEIRVRICGF